MGRSIPATIVVRLAIDSEPGFTVWETNHNLSHAALSWSADGGMLAAGTAYSTNTMTVFDADTGECTRTNTDDSSSDSVAWP